MTRRIINEILARARANIQIPPNHFKLMTLFGAVDGQMDGSACIIHELERTAGAR